MGRTAKIARKTKETKIDATLDIDGSGSYDIDTGVAFLDHMLELFAKHSMLDLKVKAKGDLDVDAHHTVEDVGIVIGQCLSKALGDKAGIFRYGASMVPMDEALVEVALDISGRGFLKYSVDLPYETIGNFETPLVEEFFSALAREGGMTIHINSRYGSNAHHVIEAVFKGFAVALRNATAIDSAQKGVPSTKDVL